MCKQPTGATLLDEDASKLELSQSDVEDLDVKVCLMAKMNQVMSDYKNVISKVKRR